MMTTMPSYAKERWQIVWRRLLQNVCITVSRVDLWGYAPQENLSNEELIDEKYQGIRPAPGYPACPERSVKYAMFERSQPMKLGWN
jgi:cobalamin-dependent methionine synthase I